MGKPSTQKYSDWEYDYFCLDLVLTLWHRRCHFLMSSFVPCWHAQTRHFIHIHWICRVRSHDVFGITLKLPEVAAGILQQTNFSLEWPPRNRKAFSDTVGLASVQRQKGSTSYICSGWEYSPGMCITVISFKAGPGHNWLPLSLFLLALYLIPSDDLEYKILSSSVLFTSVSYEFSQIKHDLF